VIPIVKIDSSMSQVAIRDASQVALKETNAIILRGYFSELETSQGLSNLRRTFNQKVDAATVGVTPDMIMKNFQKMSIGGVWNTKIYRPRFMRSIYNPIWEPDVYQLRTLFQKLAYLRNCILDYGPDYAIDAIEDDGSWTASRLQHYPTGGGFLVEHVDSVLSSVHDWSGYKQFLQFLLPLTKKGTDFSRGGGYVYVEEAKIVIDDLMSPGDVAVYSGLIRHGVDEIDPHLPLRLDIDSGRVVAFASLFKDFRKNTRLNLRYKEISG
jgi:hypothetical protein